MKCINHYEITDSIFNHISTLEMNLNQPLHLKIEEKDEIFHFKLITMQTYYDCAILHSYSVYSSSAVCYIIKFFADSFCTLDFFAR